MSSAELSARRTAAAAALADFIRYCHGEIIAGDWQGWALRLGTELRSLLEGLDTDPETAQLAQVRLVLGSFDWEADDRQYALEQIDDILRGAS